MNEKYLQKINNSLNNALKYCNESIIDSDIQKRELNFWHVCTELEYSVFHFDLFLVKKDEERFRWQIDKNLEEKLKSASLDSKLQLIKNLINKSINLINEKQFYDAYKQTVITDVLSFIVYREIYQKKKGEKQ